MIIIPTTREVFTGATKRYRGVVRIDNIEYQLAGVFSQEAEAKASAQTQVEALRALCVKNAKSISMYHERVRSGIRRAG